MKTFCKLLAIAAAFGLAPAAAYAANATGPAPQVAEATEAAPPTDPVTAAPTAAPARAAPDQARTPPTPGVGQPKSGRFGLQDQVTALGREGAWFHNAILIPLIFAISLFVLFLLAWVVVRFRRSANPTPSRTSHNTTLEVVWTLVPVLILVAIAVPSIRLLAHQYAPPQADVTIKAIGNQWYWEYEYPDLGINFVSNMVPEAEAARRGEPPQLEVDERIVVPVGATVKMIVTSNDVIHAWGVPALWTKIDAVPGRLNETWFRADREGVYYGVCYELCGARHAYMPIAVEVVSPERYRAWVAARGGTFPGARPAATPAPTVAATESTESTPAPSNVVAAIETPATSSQAATANPNR